MIIHKVFSNNAVSVYDHGTEMVLTGKGLGFGKHNGDLVDESKIECRYVPGFPINEKMEKLLQLIPVSYFDTAEQIYEFATDAMGKQLHHQLILDLADHISFAIERKQKDTGPDPYLFQDISIVYPQEYQIAQQALNYINRKYAVSLPLEEASYITFHIVNAEKGDENKSPNQIAEFVKMMLDQLTEHYPQLIGKESEYAMNRFIVHLRFLGNRIIMKRQPPSDSHNSAMLRTYMHDTELKAVLDDMNQVIKQRFHYRLSDSEKLYLAIHIHQILSQLN